MSFFRQFRKIAKSGAIAATTGGSLYYSSPFHSSPIAHCSNNLSANPFLQQNGLPQFSQYKASDVKPAVEHCISQQKDRFSKLEALIDANKNGFTFESVVEEVEKIQAPLSYTWGAVNHLMGVNNSDDLRVAHDAVQGAVVEASQAAGQSLPLYNALKYLESTPSIWSKLDEAQRRIVNSSVKQMVRSGVALTGENKAKFNTLQVEASELSTKFSNNVLDSTKKFQLLITDRNEIDGLPESSRGLASQQAGKNGHANSTPESGPWLLTLDMPSYLPAMQHIKSRSVRETLYRAFVTRASSAESDNSEVIRRLLKIRQDMAEILGYKNYAELSLSSKMAPSVTAVSELTEMLRSRSLPAAQQELADLTAFAKSKGFQDSQLNLWDVPFWSERLRESKYEYEEEALRPYFPLDSVLKGLFSLAERLFQVKIVAADGEAEVWNEDVRFFHVLEASSGRRIASFFLDPFSRPANKRGGAWMDVCLQKSRALNRTPVAYLTCNGSPPVGDQPSLMTFGEVETLFHEFGHGIQHMLTRVEYGDAAGINNIEWDAVELPSQFMENWCYDKPTVYGFAKHYQTGEPLPVELFEKIKAAKNFHAGLMMLRQLYFGALDMKLHSEYDSTSSKSPFDFQREMASRYTVIPPLPEDRFLCGFSHIFAGGYAAGYYSYKWAEVMSADAFAAFEEGNLSDEQAVRAIGMRFRDTVLSMGGGKHPSEVFRAFRGRDPLPDALLRHNGLDK